VPKNQTFLRAICLRGKVLDILSKLIVKLSDDVSALSSNIYERIDKLETSLESRITQKFANMLDKRVNSEMSRVRKDVDTQMQSFRDEVRADLNELDEKMAQIQVETIGNAETSRNQNLVIRGLAFHEGENLNSKVNKLIQDGLGLKTVQVLNSVRKTSDATNNPGTVIATLQSINDKKEVLANKSKLKDKHQYRSVYLNKDQSYAERTLARNMRVIVDALKATGSDIGMKGDHIHKNGAQWKSGGERSSRSPPSTDQRSGTSRPSYASVSAGNHRPSQDGNRGRRGARSNNNGGSNNFRGRGFNPRSNHRDNYY